MSAAAHDLDRSCWGRLAGVLLGADGDPASSVVRGAIRRLPSGVHTGEDSCLFDLGGTATSGVTIWLRKKGNSYGFCAGGECSVPTDRDPTEGWDYDGEGNRRARLPTS